MISSTGERDFSSQETAHQLLSLPLVSCTYSFIMLPLNNSRAITQDRQTGEQTIEASIVDTYALRAGLQDVNLVSFVSKYTTIKGHLARRS